MIKRQEETEGAKLMMKCSVPLLQTSSCHCYCLVSKKLFHWFCHRPSVVILGLRLGDFLTPCAFLVDPDLQSIHLYHQPSSTAVTNLCKRDKWMWEDWAEEELMTYSQSCLAHGFFPLCRWSRPMWNTLNGPRCSRLGEIIKLRVVYLGGGRTIFFLCSIFQS